MMEVAVFIVMEVTGEGRSCIPKGLKCVYKALIVIWPQYTQSPPHYCFIVVDTFLSWLIVCFVFAYCASEGYQAKCSL